MGKRGEREPKSKNQPAFELIDWQADPVLEPYRLMAGLRRDFHSHTLEAKVVLAYRKGWKPDTDGRITLGMCVKASELQRTLVDWDFVILLNHEAWMSPEFDVEKKKALLDHELCHIGVAVCKEGEPKVDAMGRRKWRIVNHDVQEFTAIISRYGTYKSDLEQFAEALMRRQQMLGFEPPNPSGGGKILLH